VRNPFKTWSSSSRKEPSGHGSATTVSSEQRMTGFHLLVNLSSLLAFPSHWQRPQIKILSLERLTWFNMPADRNETHSSSVLRHTTGVTCTGTGLTLSTTSLAADRRPLCDRTAPLGSFVLSALNSVFHFTLVSVQRSVKCTFLASQRPRLYRSPLLPVALDCALPCDRAPDLPPLRQVTRVSSSRLLQMRLK
jgi:hypothetical protein